jgi:glycosyltransferase involved in cell wall biosynthesis
MEPDLIKYPKLTIGMSIYNGEKFIQKKLENILSQTFQDFELIISDDSNDETPKICKSFVNNDKRIRYVHQPIKNGWRWNNVFTLNSSKSDYFVWTSVDDLWEDNFLEENITFLDSNPSFVGSISTIDQFDDDGTIKDIFKIEKDDSFIQKKYKQFRKIFRPWKMDSLEGSYPQKIRKYLKLHRPLYIFGILRTHEFKKSVRPETLKTEWEYSIILNLLEFGDFKVIEKTLFHYYMGGYSSTGLIGSWRNGIDQFYEIFIPFGGLIVWCAKKFGLKLIFKNFDAITWLIIYGSISFSIEIFKKLKNFN